MARTSPAPERVAVRTSDLDEAVASMCAAFGDVDLRRCESGTTSLTLRSARTADLASTRWALEGVTGAGLDQHDVEEPVFLTGVRLQGEAAIWSRQGAIDVDRPFLYPEVVNSRLTRPDIANLAVSAEAVTCAARAMAGDLAPTFRFTGTAPLDPARDALWRATMVHAARTLEALAGFPDVPLAQIGLVDHVTLTMLHVFPNTALDAEERRREAGAHHPTLRRALQHIDDHLDTPFTVPDLAAAARVSLRGLHALFRRELDTTPMAYVTAARLAAARAELLALDPTVTDVETVARRWGFVPPARFVERYQQAYGESPADTLSR